jgi:very-short-patch-repair endonuclease
MCVVCRIRRGEPPLTGWSLSEDTRRKQRDVHRGKHLSSETCKKIGAANKGRIRSPEENKKRGDSNRGKHHSPEACKKQGDAKRGDKNPSKRPEVRENLRVKTKQLWQDPEFVQKQMNSRHVAQNKTEKSLQSLIDQITTGFQFTGDGQKIIAGKCPDFVNEKRKLIIELFGDYWHSQKMTGIPEKQHEQERIKLFESAGYKTLMIWEHELNDVQKLLQRLNNFFSE